MAEVTRYAWFFCILEYLLHIQRIRLTDDHDRYPNEPELVGSCL